MTMVEKIKRLPMKRKIVLLVEFILGKTTVSKASRVFDLKLSELEAWVEDGRKGMENSMRANPL